jgi:two-component system, sensor histidine kinase and response regulator
MNLAPRRNPALTQWMNSVPARLDHFRAETAAWVRTTLAERSGTDRPALELPLVLVVDDCPVNQMLMMAMLLRWGINPLLAADGAEAVALACEHEFDLIFMDLQMPVLDGLAATAQIRRFEREHARVRVPVVAYTSSSIADDSSALSHLGLDAVLPKPCNLQSLEACLTRWCAFDFRELARQPSINAPR